jgi:hypothetical protein
LTPSQRLRYPRNLIVFLQRQGIRLNLKDGRLIATPAAAVDADMIEAIREWKPALIALLPLVDSPLWNLPPEAPMKRVRRGESIATISTPPGWVGKEKPKPAGKPATCRMCGGTELYERGTRPEYICQRCHPRADQPEQRKDKAA